MGVPHRGHHAVRRRKRRARVVVGGQAVGVEGGRGGGGGAGACRQEAAEREARPRPRVPPTLPTPPSIIPLSPPPSGAGKVVLIFDMAKTPDTVEPPLALQIECLRLAQAHYPERLGLAVVCHPPTVFWIMWRALQPFLVRRKDGWRAGVGQCRAGQRGTAGRGGPGGRAPFLCPLAAPRPGQHPIPHSASSDAFPNCPPPRSSTLTLRTR